MSPHPPLPLQPFTPPLGPQPARTPLYSPQPTTLVLRDKVLSATRENFTVSTTDPSLPAICNCAGVFPSAHKKHVFTDPNAGGAELFTLSRSILSPLPHYTAVRPDGATLFEVKTHWKMFGSKITVMFSNASDGQYVEIEVRGNWGARSAEMTIGTKGVASVRREWGNMRAMFGDANTYYVTVAPNVDLALMAAVCVCMDEALQRQNSVGTLGLVAS